nr:hypothetical protein [Tanacetum cinerariifolium]
MPQKVERLQAQLRDLKGKSSDTPSALNTLDPLNQKLETKIVELKFHVVNYERMSVTPQVDKPKLIVVTPYSKKLHASILSHSIPQPREFNVVKHSNVIAPGMFKIDPSQTFRVDPVPNNQSCASMHTARTRRPLLSSEVKKNVTVKDHRRILLLSKNHKTMSSECNNIKLAIRNDKSKIICGTVRFENDHIAAVLGYGDLKWEKAKEFLTHPNLFQIQSSSFIYLIWICMVQCELQALMVN